MDRDVNNPSKINRREMLKRAAVAGGVAWAAPMLTSLRTPAFAQYGPPCVEGCFFAVHFQQSSLECMPCEDNDCFGGCRTGEDCSGPGCTHITSVTKIDGFWRICSTCQLTPLFFRVCYRCPDPPSCTCLNASVDPIDPRCANVVDVLATCPSGEFDMRFRCAVC